MKPMAEKLVSQLLGEDESRPRLFVPGRPVNPVWGRVFRVAVENYGLIPEDEDLELAGLGDGDDEHFMEFVMGLEKEFNTEIPDGVAETFKTLEDVVTYLSKI